MEMTLAEKKIAYTEDVERIARYLGYMFYPESLNEEFVYCEGEVAAIREKTLEKADHIYQFFGNPTAAIQAIRFMTTVNFKKTKEIIDGL